MQKAISTISSASAGGALVYSKLGNDLSLVAIGAIAFGGLGYAIAYKGTPYLLKNKMIGYASLLGLLMSTTWLGNGSTIYDIYFSNLCNKIDAKYPQYKDNYRNSKTSSANTTDDEKNIIDLNSTIRMESVTISTLKRETSKKSEYYARLKETTKSSLIEIKNSNLRAWKKGAYKEYAKDYNCENPNHINFKRLVGCATNYVFMQQSEAKFIKLKEVTEKYNRDIVTLSSLRESVKSAKARANKANSKINEDENKYLAIEAKANKEAKSSEFYIYLAMWIFGLFIELFAMMFKELVDWKKEKEEKEYRIKQEEHKKNKTLKKYKEITEELAQKEINEAGSKRMISYATKEDDWLKISFRTLLKSGRRGKILAVSNSIMGAFLYAFTIKKNNKIISSWKEIAPSDILYVNGSDGTKLYNGKEIRKTIDKFFPNIKDGFDAVPTLGSTATELKSKDIKAYLGYSGGINPQQEAINYLVELEETDPNRFSPLNLSVQDLEAIATKFVRTYHPNNFKKKEAKK